VANVAYRLLKIQGGSIRFTEPFTNASAMTPPEAFGLVLKELRKEKNLSQEDLSFASCLDRTFLSRLERGKRQPSITTLFDLARALETSPSEIVSRVESRINSTDK